MRGRIVDVVVEIRQGSSTYGRHTAIELSAENWQQLLIPEGFAHGFCTLIEETEVLYKVADYYSLQHDRDLLWSDPALGIAWQVAADKAILSERDRKHPSLAGLASPFAWTNAGRAA